MANFKSEKQTPTHLHIGNKEMVIANDVRHLKVDSVQTLKITDRESALNVIAQLKIAHDIDNHTLAKKCAELRVTMGNK